MAWRRVENDGDAASRQGVEEDEEASQRRVEDDNATLHAPEETFVRAAHLVS